MKAYLCTIILIVSACSSSGEKKVGDVEINSASSPALIAVAKDSSAQNPNSQDVAFNIPALLGKNIDELTRLLGKPSETDASNLSEDELERRYVRKGYRLVINYDKKTRRVVGFFLSAPEPSGETKDCNKILAAGNLNPASSTYAIDTLRSERKGYFTGLSITTE